MELFNELTSTLEDYLEVIFNIIKHNKVARSKEIAEALKVKRSTVTVALRSLGEKGYINYEPHSYITLTAYGEKAAKCVAARHQILRDLFTKAFQLSDKEAEKTACLMEHGMDIKVCKAIISFLRVLEKNKDVSSSLLAAIKKENQATNCIFCGAELERNKDGCTKKHSSLNSFGNRKKK